MLLLKKWILTGVVLLGCITVVQCNRSSSPASSEEVEPENSGTARITVVLGKTASPGELRRSFVERCILTLTAQEHDTIRDTIVPKSDDDTVINTTRDNLDESVDWTLAAASYDHLDSVIHKGSVEFTIKAADTVDSRSEQGVRIWY